jgi:hypothetical protein
VACTSLIAICRSLLTIFSWLIVVLLHLLVPLLFQDLFFLVHYIDVISDVFHKALAMIVMMSMVDAEFVQTNINSSNTRLFFVDAEVVHRIIEFFVVNSIHTHRVVSRLVLFELSISAFSLQ